MSEEEIFEEMARCEAGMRNHIDRLQELTDLLLKTKDEDETSNSILG